MVLNLLLIQILPANPGSSLKVTAVMIPLYVSQIKLAFNPGVVSYRNNHYDKYRSTESGIPEYWAHYSLLAVSVPHSSLSLSSHVAAAKQGSPKYSINNT